MKSSRSRPTWRTELSQSWRVPSRSSTPGPTRPISFPMSWPNPSETMSRPPALVATNAAAMTRSRTTSGNCSAIDITVMPPMECPMRTSRPSGAASWMTRWRSRPSWSIVLDSREPCSDWPWLRWSHSTTR